MSSNLLNNHHKILVDPIPFFLISSIFYNTFPPILKFLSFSKIPGTQAHQSMVPTHTLHTSILSIRTLFVRKLGYFKHGIAHYSISLLRRTSLVCNSAQWSFCLGLLFKFDLLLMQSTYVEMFVSLKYLISKVLEKC